MYNYGSILGILARRHLGPGNLHLTKHGKIFLSNVTCLLLASEPTGSEEEDFLIYFYAFLWFEPRTPWLGAILDPGTFI